MERLLAWLRAEGCIVILLSATLPSTKRHALLKAWGAPVPEAESEYPRLSWFDETVPRPLSISVADSNAAKKCIHLSYLSTDINELAEVLRKKLKDGGCAAIICNTVARAQSTFAELQEILKVDFCEKENWHLFHARMPFAWRQDREEKILRAFGKDKTQRPKRAVVVATQVIEQSLDLDFDWMASELAPIDLLLQRIGRLHRHLFSVRPLLLKEPELCILCDGGKDGALPNLDVPDEMYAHYILLQTWLALRDEKVLLLIHLATDEADDMAKQLYLRFKEVAQLFDAPNAGREGARDPNPDAVAKIIDAFDPRRDFWTRLETPFYAYLTDLADNAEDAIEKWRDTLEGEAQDCFRASRDALGKSPRALRTAAISGVFRTPSCRQDKRTKAVTKEVI